MVLVNQEKPNELPVRYFSMDNHTVCLPSETKYNHSLFSIAKTKHNIEF